MPAIRVVIARRGKAARSACRGLLALERDIRVVAEAGSGLDVLAAAERLRPNVLLLDIGLTGTNGTSILPVIRRRSPQTRVLLLTRQVSEARTLKALSQGARGYLDSAAVPTFLPRAVRAINAGEAWVPRRMVTKIMDRLARFSC